MAITCRSFFDYEISGALAERIGELSDWLGARGVSLTRDGTALSPGCGLFRIAENGSAGFVEFEEFADERPTRSRILISASEGRVLAWVEQEFLDSAASSPAKLPRAPLAILGALEHGMASCGGVPLRPTPQYCEDATALPAWLEVALGPPVALIHVGAQDVGGSPIPELMARLAGTAAVVCVRGSAATLVRERVGGPFPQGAVGLVVPGRTDVRVSPATVTARQPEAIARQIQRTVLEHWLRQPVPQTATASILQFRLPPRATVHAVDAELLDMASKENAGLRSLLQEVQDDRELKTLELDEALQELDNFKRRARFLEKRLSELNEFPSGIPDVEDLPTAVNTCEDAMAYAGEYLRYLVISPDAAAPAADLDQFPEASVWAKKAWQSLQALNDYALKKQEGTFDGTFIEYCNDPPTQSLPVPSTWVSLNESESTAANAACRKARTFTVPRSVEAAGALYMPGHIKIQLRGSPAPRLHFWDGTGGSTGRVYVGYFGRHLPTA